MLLPHARERSSPRKGKSPSWLLNKDLSQHDFGLEVPRSSICLDSSNKTIYISVCTYEHVSKQVEDLSVHEQAAMAHVGLADTSTGLQPSFASTLPLVRQPASPQTLPLVQHIEIERRSQN